MLGLHFESFSGAESYNHGRLFGVGSMSLLTQILNRNPDTWGFENLVIVLEVNHRKIIGRNILIILANFGTFI